MVLRLGSGPVRRICDLDNKVPGMVHPVVHNQHKVILRLAIVPVNLASDRQTFIDLRDDILLLGYPSANVAAMPHFAECAFEEGQIIAGIVGAFVIPARIVAAALRASWARETTRNLALRQWGVHAWR